MLKAIDLGTAIENGAYDNMFSVLYGVDAIRRARTRYGELVDAYGTEFSPDAAVSLFSAPGRSEISGNHTDHQNGHVLAAAVSLDFAAVAGKQSHNTATIASAGYQRFQVKLDHLSPRQEERNSTRAFVRGIAAYFRSHGYQIGGFNAVMQSDVPRGSGLSSSAAYGVLLGSIWNGLYNDGHIPFQEIALAAQYAENQYFGKPSGLMDQMASAAGGFTAIDFCDPVHPVVEKIDCNIAALGYAICIVNAGGSHAGLTGEYATIPGEMRLAAKHFGKAVLREVDRATFYQEIPALRISGVPDRAILRSMHFFDENERAVLARDALKNSDMSRFLQLINASGRSSENLLQNICAKDKRERSISLALALSQRMLSTCGAWRVHGGGFAGTIQAILPLQQLDAYVSEMERVFGQNCCYRLRVRIHGGIML